MLVKVMSSVVTFQLHGTCSLLYSTLLTFGIGYFFGGPFPLQDGTHEFMDVVPKLVFGKLFFSVNNLVIPRSIYLSICVFMCSIYSVPRLLLSALIH